MLGKWVAGFALLGAASQAFAADVSEPRCRSPHSGEPGIESLEKSAQAVTDYSESALTKTARLLVKDLDQKVPKRIPDAVLDQAWNKIERKLKASVFLNGDEAPFFLKDGEIHRTIAKLNLARLKKIFASLKAKGKIRYLDESAKAQLELNEYLCKRKDEKCKELTGLYNPLSGDILITAGQSPDELAQALFHEIKHAFQFTYRFPLDLTKIRELATQGKINRRDISKFLSAYYEYQANYATMQYAPAKEWTKTFQKPTDVKDLANELTFGLLGRVRNNSMNSYLPEVDRHEIGKGIIIPGPHAALGPSELVPTPGYSLGGRVNEYNLDWHHLYAQSLNRTYYDDDTPTSELTEADAKMHVALHNNYYKKLASNTALENDPKCQTLINNLLASEDSPLVQWLDSSRKDVQKCAAFADAPTPTELKEFEDAVLSSSGPFVFGGGEGDSPGLKVYPILPALKVVPNE